MRCLGPVSRLFEDSEVVPQWRMRIMPTNLSIFHVVVVAWVMLGEPAWAQPSNTEPGPKAVSAKPSKPSKAALPARNLTVELRVSSESAPAGAVQQWSAAAQQEEEWQKLTVANGEKARFDMQVSQPWAWPQAVVRGNGTGSVDAVSQNLQWVQDMRALECQVQWTGGNKPVRLDVAVQIASSGMGSVEGVQPQPRRNSVSTVVWAPLGQWFTLARSGPRPAIQAEGSYSSRTAESSEAKLLQIRVLVPD